MAFSGSNLPQLLSVENRGNGDRGYKSVPMASSSSHLFGGFFDPTTGTNGAQTFAANQNIRGIVRDIEVYINGNYMSITDVAAKGLTGFLGTYTAPTTLANARYVASASNATATFPDRILFDAVNINDEINVVLTNASGVPVPRGTTAGSNTLNQFLEPNPNFTNTALESGVSAVATGLCFQIVGRPRNTTRVIVKLINSNGAVS